MEELKPCLLTCNLEQLNGRINTLGLEIARMGNNDAIRVHKDFLVATLGYMEELFGLRREKLNRAAPENKALTLEQLKVENAQLRAVITQNDPNFFKRKCRVCGCDWNHPCNNHDYWVEDDLCSACASLKSEKRIV